ncbi:hypothetical protein QMU90_002311 [Edwardsiella ictaluri]|nr:hypothetical protein [Edwardsiella ictaluri]
MDVLAGISAFKQVYELIKVIKESHDVSVIKQAAGDLYERITELQTLNAELSGLYQAERNITVNLRDENRKIKMFVMQSENYELYTTEGGSVVYRPKPSSDAVVNPHYLCANCFREQKISILQPVTKSKVMGYSCHYCPRCKNEFLMEKRLIP